MQLFGFLFSCQLIMICEFDSMLFISIILFPLKARVSLADVQFLPISGLVGSNIKTRVGKSVCGWWNGPCLFEVLDTVEVPPRDPKGPLRY